MQSVHNCRKWKVCLRTEICNSVRDYGKLMAWKTANFYPHKITIRMISNFNDRHCRVVVES
jgi:hypothetical protein